MGTNGCKECDRSFTRSDALSKHMRTVHETEALKPSEPLAKQNLHLGPATSNLVRIPRIKLKLSQLSRDGDYDPERSAKDDVSQIKEPMHTAVLGPGAGFSIREMSMPLTQLYRLLRRQLHWAEQESKRLESEWQTITRMRKETWREKELVLEDVIHAELRVFKSALSAEDLAIARRAYDFHQ